MSSGTLSWTPDIVLSLLPDMELSPGARSQNGQLGRHPRGPSPRSRFSRCGCFQEQTFQSCCSAVSVACAYLVTWRNLLEFKFILSAFDYLSTLRCHMEVCIWVNSLPEMSVPTHNGFVGVSDDQDPFATISEHIFKPNKIDYIYWCSIISIIYSLLHAFDSDLYNILNLFQ